MTNFASPNAYPVDERGVAYSMAFFSAKHLGAGQYYLMTIRDKGPQSVRRQWRPTGSSFPPMFR